MVQCDVCDFWYHFSCVEVSQSVEEINWSCPGCASVLKIKTNTAIPVPKDALETKKISENHSKQSLPPDVTVSAKSTGKSNKRSDRRKIELQRQKLDEERECQLKYLEQKYSRLRDLESENSSQVSNPDSILDNAAKVQEWIEDTENCGDDSGLADVDPEDEHVSRKSQVPQGQKDPLQEPRQEHIDHVARLVNELLTIERRAPTATADPMGNTRNPQGNMHVGLSVAERGLTNPRALEQRVTISEAWAQRSAMIEPPIAQDRTFERPVPPSNLHEETIRNQPRAQSYSNSRSDVHTQRLNRRETETFTDGLDFVPGQGSTPVPQSRQRIIPPAIGMDNEDSTYTLNRSQLAARQAVSKDLPDFGGNPEDWPLFFSIFNSSTQLCGFSNEENMLRLRKCLKGKALEAVKCRLLHPSNVHGIMSTLKMLYGRPETIIQAIVWKIRSLPSPVIEKLDTVIHFALSVENLVATVEACEIGDFMYNASLRYELVERLPPTLKLNWARNSNPNLQDFSMWLRFVAEDSSTVSILAGGDNRHRTAKRDGFLNLHAEEDCQSHRKLSNAPMVSKTYTPKESGKVCVGCKGICLTLAQCKRFKELSYDSRWAVVRKCKVCRKCLRKHNGPCKQKRVCGTDGCSYLHYPLLHDEGKHSSTSSATPARAAPQTQRNQATSTSCNVHQGQSEILFRIVPVLLFGPSKMVRTYAFIDDGSELTLMEQSLADELGVQGPTKSLCLRWTGGANRTEDLSQKVNFQISSVTNPSKKLSLREVHTVESLQLRPQTLLMPEILAKYRHLMGLPVESYQEVSPRLLIGLDHASLGNVMNYREGKPNEPIAVKTRLGWMIYGCCSSARNGTIGISKPNKLLLSNDDQRANELLQSLTRYTNGRYESGLLWRYDNVRLPDSRAMALRRWECLDRRMQRVDNLAQELTSKIIDYLGKGYIRKLTEEELKTFRERVWYLPMFPVANPNKPGKIRLVWDAAATSYGVSLNSVLLKGPDQLTSLMSILIQFREFRVAVSGDIREMYHQVRIRPAD
ncbi:uncharacterized protein LOC131694254 [Topomyia yanbarensis]|uniref:uncharacterized protein LOC131694254 n=1 Tax=Topomyia yanbarensis TaxID=2498891 RepID=UPI00273B2882|nr:uncharacterized protein LOC131694254 [Topomyia yanbarensis]